MPEKNRKRRRNLSLGSLPLRAKVAAVVAAPVAALVVVASVAVADKVSAASEGNEVAAITESATLVTRLVDELQTERSLSGRLALEPENTIYRTQFDVQTGITDAVAADVAASVSDYDSGLAGRYASDVEEVLTRVAGLSEFRDAVIEGPPPFDPFRDYDPVINDLLVANDQVAGATDEDFLDSQISAFTSLSRYKELVASQSGLLHQVFSANKFTRDQYAELAKNVTEQEVLLQDFLNSATDEQVAYYEEQTRSPVDVVGTMQTRALNRPNADEINIDPNLWVGASTAQLDRIADVENRLTSDVLDAAEAQAQSSTREALLYGFGALAIVLLSIGIAVVIARSITGPLRRLTGAALGLRDELPEVVERIQDAEAPMVRHDPIRVESDDEVGHLAAAFNAVNEVALDVATEQAALRASIADMVLNLARRNQSLLDRQLQYLDDLEDHETDPDDLQHLFTLDHLATRMRRNAESLLVLAGADPSRRRREPVPVADVIRAAASEVEDYARIDILTTSPLACTGNAAASVAHLLAELLENATSFSPPGTRVTVTTEQAGEAVRIIISDRGLGMSEEELNEANERLSRAALIDVALSKRLGFSVVGRVAERFGIRVRLSHSEGGGVTATVVLPPSILCAPGGEPLAAPDGAAGALPPVEPSVPSSMDDALPPVPSSLAGLESLAPAPPEPAPLRRQERQERVARQEPEGLHDAPGLPRRNGNGHGAPAAPEAPTGPTAPVVPGRPPVPPAPAGPSADRPQPPAERQQPPAERQQPPTPAPAHARQAPLPTRQPKRPGAPGAPTAPRQAPARPAGPFGRPTAPAPAGAAAPSPASGGSPELTAAGLPKRRKAPVASAPRPAAPSQPVRPSPTASPDRSPEQLRAMLSRFQQGTQTGRAKPAGSDLPFQPTEDAT